MSQGQERLASLEEAGSGTLSCTSPDCNITIGFTTTPQGLHWWLVRKGKNLIAPSRLGLSFSVFKEKGRELGELRIVGKRAGSLDTTWTNGLYRRWTIRDAYNELEVSLEEVAEPHRRLGLVFRAYDTGAA
ncbi:MAG: glycoside hydrolase family 97 N-terminal domain-containing protein, partial [Kiritimatiellae bacterium]|nr:glycoside hydrolase family 97 N-terminal domain-containing protein [Kiritimatiellia bacterium]